MALRIVAGTANPALARDLAASLGCPPPAVDIERFPDGELRPVVGDVQGADVYVIEPTGPPVNDRVVELLLLLDACRRAGAARTTAVVPYFGYARQDRRTRPGQAVAARVIADALAGAGAQRLVVVDPHTPAIEAINSIPVEILSAVPILADAVAARLAEDTVVVAPDLGAIDLAERYAARLCRPVAVIRKHRLSGEEVAAEEVVGAVDGRPALVVDDMISTGATIEAAVRVLRAHGAAGTVAVAATHGVLTGAAVERLQSVATAGVVVTDSLAPTSSSVAVQRCSIAPLLADAIGRLHGGGELTELRARS